MFAHVLVLLFMVSQIESILHNALDSIGTGIKALGIQSQGSRKNNIGNQGHGLTISQNNYFDFRFY